ncbi:MAG: hypothetical protein GF353_20085 [Candidatus Lokiarchaeota archaeon]|nr:hypothetical protein [Candidatus Lokiarchaeota archaeon]
MNSGLIKSNTLHREVEQLKLNFKKNNDAIPETYLAAEMISNTFDELITKNIEFKNASDWQYASTLMIFGSYQSWMNAYIMTCVGYYDIGLMSLRRSIEYVCYLSKIYQSDKRARIWMGKWDDNDNRKKFANKFSIPSKYFSQKYSHLMELLVMHDYASDFGVHGNFEVLTTKYKKDEKTGQLIFSFVSVRDNIELPIGMMLMAGYRILQSIISVLKDYINNYAEFSGFFDNLSKAVHQARLKSVQREYKGLVPREILDAINSDNREAFEDYFRKLKEKFSNRSI